MIERLSKNPLALAALVLIAAVFGAGAFWLVQRGTPSSLGSADQARVERVVRDYVLAHPEIIPEAMQRLREREAGKVIDANASAILKPFGSAWAGNPNGDVTVVEYFDYNCGYCRASLPNVAQLIASDPKVKVVYRELPILAETSAAAAKLSLAAADQGKFTAFHDALYAAGPVTPESMTAAAQKAGVDMQRAAAFAPRAEAEIASNLQVMRQLGMTGTPSFVIGNQVVSSVLTLEELQKAVAEARARS